MLPPARMLSPISRDTIPLCINIKVPETFSGGLAFDDRIYRAFRAEYKLHFSGGCEGNGGPSRVA